MQPQNLTENVQAGNEYLQIKLNTNPRVTVRQVEKEEEEVNPELVQVTQFKPSEREVLL